MTKPKLYYFAIRGLGELLRQLFALAEVEYEDVRIWKEWEEFKGKTPFGKMPVLEVDGKMIPQSFAIARYIATKHGLAGKTPFEAAWVDALADQWKDFHNEFQKFFYPVIGFGKGDLEELKKAHGIPERDKFFPIIEKQLKNTNSGFLVGSSVTWVDALIAEQVEQISTKVPGFLDGFPEVLKHSAKIHAIPQLAKYIQHRNATEVQPTYA
ncbi:hypothetical protein PFISCL1PPCAC_12595 [Pristionchus fissidentatus]|uniref:Glutathione S-transferase n=1 Tax=Pristionchus fissidentatus TaxID=1538716 RepID=A0AAV5VSL1_9BILA|nr:hypothetical protein PFISCL1PPCAC_12595 [Pristionchus fissidentatus]